MRKQKEGRELWAMSHEDVSPIAHSSWLRAKQRTKSAALIITFTLVATAAALIPTPSSTQVLQARDAGTAISIREGGYDLGAYLLRAYNQDVILKPGSPEVDGIVLSTPYESIRYEAYLAHLEGKPLTDAQAQAFAQAKRGQLTFRVYSHSPYSVADEAEQWQLAYKTDKITLNPDRAKSYLDFYKAASLTLGGRTYQAKPALDGPYVDNFTLPSGKATFRNLGVISYTFSGLTLPSAATFTLAFHDSQGKAYRITGNLKDYR